MTGLSLTIRGVRNPTRRRRAVSIAMLAYLALILQPCALAMDTDGGHHQQNCHDETTIYEDAACLSQPAIDCSSDDFVADGRDPWKTDSPMQLAIVVDYDDFASPSGTVLDRASCRGPPVRPVSLHVLNCVYLK